MNQLDTLPVPTKRTTPLPEAHAYYLVLREFSRNPYLYKLHPHEAQKSWANGDPMMIGDKLP
jgi:hypothetical protein